MTENLGLCETWLGLRGQPSIEDTASKYYFRLEADYCSERYGVSDWLFRKRSEPDYKGHAKSLSKAAKGPANNNYNSLALSGVYRVIPLSMERATYQIDGGELFVRDLDSSGITPWVQFRLDAKSALGSGIRN